jgi:HK97 family phage portal protein
VRLRLPQLFRRKRIDPGRAEQQAIRRLLASRETDVVEAVLGSARELLNPAFQFTSWTYACIQTIATRGAACPWQVVRTRGDTVQDATADSPLGQLISAANPQQDAIELFCTTLINVELWGNAYWLVQRDRGNRPVALWPLPPEKVTVGALTPEGYVSSYSYLRSDGQVERVPASDMVWFRYPGPGSAVDTAAPLSAAQAIVQLDILCLRFLTAFFTRGASPEFAISFPHTLSEAEYERFRARWIERYQGLQRYFSPLILEGGATIERGLGATPSPVWLELRRQIREEILGMFGVPPAIVGVYEYANYANAREQSRLFWANCLQPRLDRLAGAINQQLAPQFGKDTRFRWDYAAVHELRPDYAEAVATAVRAAGQPVLTVNEARSMILDLPSVPWGDSPPPVPVR